MSDSTRVAEWRDVFDLLDIPAELHHIERAELFKAKFEAAMGPKEPWLLTDVAGEGAADGKLTLLEFAFFMAQQQLLPRFFIPDRKLESSEVDPEILASFEASTDLFAAIKRHYYLMMHYEKGDRNMLNQVDPVLVDMACSSRHLATPMPRGKMRRSKERATRARTIAPRAHFSDLQDGMSFEEFFTVMVQDEADMEKLAGGHGDEIGNDLFEMIDGSGGTSDNDNNDKMISRAELKRAFAGIPKFSGRAIDDFVYLFPLNNKGTIDKADFLHVLSKLRILSHTDS